MLQPAELCTKIGEREMELVHTKHPDARPPSAAILDTYLDCPPELVPINIIDYMVTEVLGRLSGRADPGETDSVSLHHWLLRFGAASGELQPIVADFTEWLRLGPAQDVHFFYTRSHLSALQNCALILPNNCQFIFTFKYRTKQLSRLIV